MLAHALKVDPDYILDAYQDESPNTEEETPIDTSSLMWINLSILAFIGIPFGNLIVPYIVWKKFENSEAVADTARRIITIQIIWSGLLAISLCVVPFIPTSFSLILVVLFAMMVANIFWVLFSAYAIQRDLLTVFDIPVRLIP